MQVGYVKIGNFRRITRYVENIASVFPEATQTIRHRTRRSAVLLHHSLPSRRRVCLPSVALQPFCCTDKGAEVAATEGDEILSIQWLFIVTWDRQNRSTHHNGSSSFKGFYRRSVSRESSCLYYLLTNGTQLLRTDCGMQKHLNHHWPELKNFETHLYHTASVITNDGLNDWLSINYI